MIRPWRATPRGAHAARRSAASQLRRLLLTATLALTLVGCFVTLRQSAGTPPADRGAMVLTDRAAGQSLPGRSVAGQRVAGQPAAGRPAAARPVDGQRVDSRTVAGELKRLVVYGHSIPSGVGASRVSRGYAVLAAEATGLQLVNHAYGGSSVASAARILASSPRAGAKDAVVIHTGLNDVFRRGENAATFGRGLVREMLSRTTEAGRRVLVLECQPSSWAHTPAARNLQTAYERWNDMLRRLASSRDVDLLDTCQRWDARKYTDESRFHPSDQGHALLARELVTLLRSGG